MRKTIVVALGAIAALAVAAAALAAVFTASGVSATTATLATTAASDVRTRTCTGADTKTFTITDGRYTGTASFTNPAAELNGPLTVFARTTVDSSSKLGYVEGTFRIKDDDTRVSGRFWGTLDASGNLAGFLTGSSRGSNAKVLGTLGGKFSTATGLTGSLGSGSITPAAVLAGPVCKGKPDRPKPTPRPKRFEIKGTLAINGNPATSVTVTAKGPTTATCNLDGSSPSLSGFANNDRVEMKCEGVVNNNVTTWLLRGLKKHR